MVCLMGFVVLAIDPKVDFCALQVWNFTDESRGRDHLAIHLHVTHPEKVCFLIGFRHQFDDFPLQFLDLYSFQELDILHLDGLVEVINEHLNFDQIRARFKGLFAHYLS